MCRIYSSTYISSILIRSLLQVYKVSVPALSAGHQQEMYDQSSNGAKNKAAHQGATLQLSKPVSLSRNCMSVLG